MQNAQPRFGIDDDGSLYDYQLKVNVPVGPEYATEYGRWDTVQVVELIKAGKPIEDAYRGNAPQAEVVEQPVDESGNAIQPPADPVDQANKDFVESTPPAPEGDKVEEANKDFSGERFLNADGIAAQVEDDLVGSLKEPQEIKPEDVGNADIIPDLLK